MNRKKIIILSIYQEKLVRHFVMNILLKKHPQKILLGNGNTKAMYLKYLPKKVQFIK